MLGYEGRMYDFRQSSVTGLLHSARMRCCTKVLLLTPDTTKFVYRQTAGERFVPFILLDTVYLKI